MEHLTSNGLIVTANTALNAKKGRSYAKARPAAAVAEISGPSRKNRRRFSTAQNLSFTEAVIRILVIPFLIAITFLLPYPAPLLAAVIAVFYMVISACTWYCPLKELWNVLRYRLA